MFRFLILLNLILTPFLAMAYNRAQCDNLIDVKKYIVAGSLDNQSAGGKTYSFKKIVGAIENELLSGQPPRPDYFTCMNMLHKKANEDATEYWFGRLARSTCALDSGNIPDVKPPSCDDDLWQKFHASKADIERSAARVTELTTKCVSRGNVKSCESMKSLQSLVNIQEVAQDVAENIAAKTSDECCDTKDGKAFKVLRGFYTIEFSDTSDAELQKECYKRTRAQNKVDSFSKAGWTAAKCAKGLLYGLGEAVLKWFKLAKSLSELGSLTEVWSALTSPGIGDKILSLLKTMADQMSAQYGATVGCFTGEYRGEQICKLASSFLMDFIVGGGIGKGIKFLFQLAKATVHDVGILAKNLVASGTSKVAAKVATKAGPNTAVARVATSVSNSTARAAAKTTASSLAKAIKPIADFSTSVASRIRKFREKENIKLNPTNRIDPTWGPNAATAVGPGATSAIEPAITTVPATIGGSAGSSTIVGASTATSAKSFTNMAVSFIDKLPKVDIKAIRSSTTKINKTLQRKLDSVTSFEKKARANAASTNPAASARSSVWANQSNRAISKDALRRHKEIQDLYRKRIISDEQAHAMHELIRVTENSATGTATRFNTQYIPTPNANPSTFVLKERGAPVTVVGALGLALSRSTYSDVGSLTTIKEIEQTSDAANGQRYDLATIKASTLAVIKINEKPDSVRDEFSKLTTESDILDRADELRAKIKVVENSAGRYFSADAKKELGDLTSKINKERDRALERIKPTDAAAPAPASDDRAVEFGIPIDPDAE